MIRFCTFVVGVLFASSVYANVFTISDIRLEGLQRVSASPVFAALTVQVGDQVDRESIRQNIQSIYRTGFFSNVQIARDGDVLIIILQERPAIKSIEIDGNKAIKTEQLEDVLAGNDITEGEILQAHVLTGIARELQRSYVSQARYGASVDIDIEDLPNNMANVKIQVDEGKAAKIRHLNFVGNKVFSDKQLLDIFELTTAKITTIFSSNDQYAKEKLTGDIEKLESFYLDQGYLDFAVESTQVSISPDRRSVYITLNLNEGDIYTVSEVDVGGELIFSEGIIRRLLLTREGSTFSQALMDGTSEYITTLLGNSGYTNAKVEGLTEKNPEDNTVKVTFFIDPGKRVYVRRIEFSGNTKTTDEVLRREMRQMESASASNARIEQSKVRLERLAYFKGVNVETKEVPGSDDLIDVEYTVEEQPSGSISASLGYARFSGLNLGLSVEQANWLGTGKAVSFGVNKNSFQTAYNFGYNDPYFTPDGVSRGFSAFYSTRDTTRLRITRFSADTFGGQMRFGYPISEVSRLDFSFGLESQSITTGAAPPQEIRRTPFLPQGAQPLFVRQSDLDALALGEIGATAEPEFITNDLLVTGEPGFLDTFGNDFTYGTFDISWVRSTLNRGILATRGNSQRLRFETTAPGGDLEFFKVAYDAEMFKPLTRHFTLRLKTSLGYGGGYGSKDELPFFENFYAGGFGSVRGFEQLSLGPKGSLSQDYARANNGLFILCDDPSADTILAGPRCEEGKLRTTTTGFVDRRNNAIGGNVLVEFGAEILLPIPFIEDSRSMQLVTFVDAGNVFSSYCGAGQEDCTDVDFDELRSSAGLGFTWISGFGPMTFSYARPTAKGDNDEFELFEFTFGAGF